MKRGDIYWAELKPRSGSEQTGRRPVVVISNDIFNQNDKWNSIIVIPLSTSKNQSKRGPTAIHLQQGEANLNKSGYALCHQVTTLDRKKMTKHIGTISELTLVQVEIGLKIALGMRL